MWINETTHHTKKSVPGWRWQHGGAELFSSTQLLSHVHCEAEMYLTGLHEWVSWVLPWTPLTLFRQKNLSSLELTKREWQHYVRGRIETYKGRNIGQYLHNDDSNTSSKCKEHLAEACWCPNSPNDPGHVEGFANKWGAMRIQCVCKHFKSSVIVC